METIKVYTKLSLEERETTANYDSANDMWIMESMTPKIFRKALKQGWTPLKQYVYEDGTVCGMVFKVPYRAITLRNIQKKQMSEKQLGNLPQDDE